jgi:hypothetical protein
MTDDEKKAIAQAEVLQDPKKLRQMIRNAKGKSQAVEAAAFRRLVTIMTGHEAGTVQHDCWSMVETIEELRRAAGRKVSRMHRMRPKIAKDGEIAALEYCALNETAGFAEIMAFGRPDLTAEAIVLRHPSHFSAEALVAARTRLEN